MLTAEERMELDVLRKHGAGIRELARVTGWSRNTVRRYLREGEAAAVRKPAPKRAEKLDPFKAYIVDRVKAAAPDRIPAVVLFREIKARGYDGGGTRVKQFDLAGPHTPRIALGAQDLLQEVGIAGIGIRGSNRSSSGTSRGLT